jgi:hypothetical protein
VNETIFLQDYEHIGRAFCETLMDFYDDSQVKVNSAYKRIVKIRKKEKKIRKATKAKKLAETQATNDKNDSEFEVFS